MTKTFHNLSNHKTDSRKFGGVIYQSDFETSRPNGHIAERIENDFRFDRQCERNAITRDNLRKDVNNGKINI